MNSTKTKVLTVQTAVYHNYTEKMNTFFLGYQHAFPVKFNLKTFSTIATSKEQTFEMFQTSVHLFYTRSHTDIDLFLLLNCIATVYCRMSFPNIGFRLRLQAIFDI